MDGWYYKLFSIECGPVSMEKLVELIKDRSLSRNDEVRFGTKGSWRRVGSIGPLMAHLPFEAGEKIVADGAALSHSGRDRTTATIGHNPENQNLDIDFAKSVTFAEPLVSDQTDNDANFVDSAETVEVAKPPEAESRWWCTIQGKEYGPVDLPKLVEWAASGRLRRDDHVRLGLDPYLRADDLPGLFPEMPKSAMAETKTDHLTRPTTVAEFGSKTKPTEAVPAASPLAETKPAIAETRPATSPMSEKPATPAAASTGSASSMSASNGAAPSNAAQASRSPTPAAKAPTPARPPFKPPVKKSSGGGKLGALLPIGLGVGGVVVVIALIFVAIQMIPPSTVEEVRRLKVLQDGYSSMQKLRDAGTKPSDDELKAAKDKIIAATKTVADELKKIERKNSYQESLRSLASKMKSVATATFDEKQKSKTETDVANLTTKLEKDLGLK